jgi:hypothetical protein
MELRPIRAEIEHMRRQIHGKFVTFSERGFRQPPQKSCLAGCIPRWMSFVLSATGN